MKYNFYKHNLHNDKIIFQDIKKIEETFPVPLYIYNGRDAWENAAEIQRCLGSSVRLCYAVKANYFLAESLIDIAAGFEICSRGELEYCLETHVPAGKISYSGVWKSEEDVRRALKVGVRRFVSDSSRQLAMLQKLAGTKVKVLLRLSSGNQFGMNVPEIEKILSDRSQYPSLEISGIHYYAGTQRQFRYQLERDFRLLADALDYFENKGVSMKELQIGGGLGFPLFETDKIEEYENAADYLFGFIRSLSEHYQVTYECGRVIAANAGRYVTKVFEKKQREGREILFVQGGSHHIRYYGNVVGQRAPFIGGITKEKRQGECEYMVCGSLCSSADILSMEFKHRPIEIGDYLLFYNAGAYNLQEASNLFLGMEMPGILRYNKNNNQPKMLDLGWSYHER